MSIELPVTTRHRRDMTDNVESDVKPEKKKTTTTNKQNYQFTASSLRPHRVHATFTRFTKEHNKILVRFIRVLTALLSCNCVHSRYFPRLSRWAFWGVHARYVPNNILIRADLNKICGRVGVWAPTHWDLGEIYGLLVRPGKVSNLLTDHLVTG